jgi:hypothetical protein
MGVTVAVDLAVFVGLVASGGPMDVAVFAALLSGVLPFFATEKLVNRAHARRLALNGVPVHATVQAVRSLGPSGRGQRLELELSVPLPEGTARRLRHRQILAPDIAVALIAGRLKELRVVIHPRDPALLTIDGESNLSLEPTLQSQTETPSHKKDGAAPKPAGTLGQAQTAGMVAAMAVVAVGIMVLSSTVSTNLTLGVSFGAVGLLSVLFSAARWSRGRRLMKRGVRKEVPAKVAHSGAGRSRGVKLIADFVDRDGTLWRVTSLGSNSSWAFLVGEPIAVFYDPHDPRRALIARDLGMGVTLGWRLGAIFGGLGILFVVLDRLQ